MTTDLLTFSRAACQALRLRATLVFLTIAIVANLGCQGPLKPVFTDQNPPIVWPKSPDQPRIRYIGQLTGEDSLHAPAKGLQSLGELFTGPKPKIGFSTPMSVIAKGDLVFVADGQNQAVYRMDLASRSFATIRDTGSKRLEWPIDLAFAKDSIAVVDSKRAAIFLFNMDGVYQRTIGEGQLKRPASITHDASTDELFVIDSGSHNCKVFDATGTKIRTIGARGAAAGEINFPTGIARLLDRGFAIADSMNFRIQILRSDGLPLLSFGHKGDAAGDFALPRDVATDSQGNIYVLDNQFENIQLFDDQGRLLMALGQEGRGPGEFYLPAGISIDDQDRIWIADTYNRRVQVFQYLKETQP
ncbi:MAG: 6-bladed beta-propeller [Planctomycetota bacterium]